MDENTTPDAPDSPPRRRRLRRPALIAGGVVVGLLAPYVASAVTPTFPDVPVSHPFFDEIEWMNDTGVTTGFGDGTYRPNQSVTRGNMAAFMQRLYDVQDDMSWTYGTGVHTAGATFADVPGAQVSVQVPDGVYANLTARFTAESECAGAASTWCSVRILVSKDGGGFVEMYPNTGDDAAFDAASDDRWESHAIERLYFGDPGSTYTFKVQSTRVGSTEFYLDDWSLVAETDLQPSDYIPF
jgi:hypothetical protein